MDEWAHTLNPSAWEAGAGRSLKFEASLVNKTSSIAAEATQRNRASKNKKINTYINKNTLGDHSLLH